jgi:transposase
MRKNLFGGVMNNGSGSNLICRRTPEGSSGWTIRRVISGIVHVLKSGCRWCDCPPECGPPTTIYNRPVRWARRVIWESLFRELAGSERSTDM